MRAEAWCLAACFNAFFVASSPAEPALKVVPDGPPMPHMPKSSEAMRQELGGSGTENGTEALVSAAFPGSPCQDVYQLHSQVRQSPILTYVSHLSKWLRESPHQAGIATCAVFLGLLCTWDGPRIWEVLVIAGSSLLSAWLIHFEAHLKNGVPSLFAEGLLILSTASTVAMAVHIGFEGSQVIVGAVLGFVSAACCSDWARAADGTLPGIALLWYCTGGVLGVWVLVAWRRPLLSTVAPLFGSYLVVSGFGSLVSEIAAWPGLPRQGVWSLDALVLLGPAGPQQALVWNATCALLAATSHRSGRPILALVLLVGYVSFVAVGALLAGLQCHAKGRRADGTRCPAFLAVPDQWQWQLSGCTTWLIGTLLAGWKQMLAKDPESKGKVDSRARGVYMPVKEISAEDGLMVNQAVDPLKTRLPSESEASIAPPAKPLTLSGYVHSIHTRRGNV